MILESKFGNFLTTLKNVNFSVLETSLTKYAIKVACDKAVWFRGQVP